MWQHLLAPTLSVSGSFIVSDWRLLSQLRALRACYYGFHLKFWAPRPPNTLVWMPIFSDFNAFNVWTSPEIVADKISINMSPRRKGDLPEGRGKSPRGTSSRSWWGGRSRWGWRWCRGGARRARGRPGSSRRGWGSSWAPTSRRCRTTPCGSCDVGSASLWAKIWCAQIWTSRCFCKSCLLHSIEVNVKVFYWVFIHLKICKNSKSTGIRFCERDLNER